MFDVIVCWKSDRLSRDLYPAAALMEVVEARQIRLESVMDAIDMKTFGIMAAIGKIELDNLRERSSMGKRGAANLGRVPTSAIPYGYWIGADGKGISAYGQKRSIATEDGPVIYEQPEETWIPIPYPTLVDGPATHGRSSLGRGGALCRLGRGVGVDSEAWRPEMERRQSPRPDCPRTRCGISVSQA